MIELALSADDQKKYAYALKNQSLKINVDVTVLDMNEDPLHAFEAAIIGGQVDYDMHAPRHLTLQVQGYVPFDPDSPSTSAVYAHRMIAVRYMIRVPALERYVTIPVFHGPVASVDMQGGMTTIEAYGKEVLLQEPHTMWRTLTRKKGAVIVNVMKDILAQKGEQKIDFPDMPDRKLPKPFSATPDQAPWDALQKLAKSLNRQLYYDGRGYARLRQWPAHIQWSWPNPLTEPELTYSMADVRNAVKVYGPETHGKYTRIKAVAIAPPSHPLSPVSLAWNGVPRYMVDVEDIQAPTPPTPLDPKQHHDAKTIAKYKKQYATWHTHYMSRTKYANELANDTLHQKLAAVLDAQFNAHIVPQVEEGDTLAVAAKDQMVTFRFTTGSLPLQADENGMSVGWHRRMAFQDRWKPHKRPRHGGNPP